MVFKVSRALLARQVLKVIKVTLVLKVFRAL
jgi:hypothetical protein